MSIGPGATIGILGGGQLGRMTALAARGMGYRVHILDPEPNCPAAPVAERVITASFDDVNAAADLASQCAVVTVEIERISRAALEAAGRHAPTRPSPDVLGFAQDRRAEKTWLNAQGFETAPWRAVSTLDELRAAVAALGPCVAKTAREGYDGKGQARLSPGADVEQAWNALGKVPCVVEAWLPLERELSVVVARSPSGETRSFPVALNHHISGVLDWSVMPGPVPIELAARADVLGRRIAEAMKLEGLLGIELFAMTDGRLLVNEMAPRPHNTGHPATEACGTSQFEQLVRAVCDLPLGTTEVLRPGAIANLLGDLWTGGEPRWDEALRIDGVRLHLYGKASARPGRKMGHLAAIGPTAEEAVRRVLAARDALVKR